MNQTAFINPAILSWSRQRAGLSEAKVAKSLTMHLERVREWEVGQSLPTFNQAQKMGRYCKYPFWFSFPQGSAAGSSFYPRSAYWGGCFS
ncbi:hypothetical protein SAMN04490184_4247 [Pseudomonas extremorientalis]|uniref:XRE family transcriptional regulator n=1 Tax=Pseudomonas extremorientalis TaxID=169669 RepID=A0ABY0SXQ0_9PSED|nr:hypothetical protein SAMN04490184_4247 [Pseudomonas extremorientalis]